MFLEGGEEMSRLAQKDHKNCSDYDSTQALIFWTWGTVSLSVRDILCARGFGPPQNLVLKETEPRPLMNERGLFTAASLNMELIRCCTGHLIQ